MEMARLRRHTTITPDPFMSLADEPYMGDDAASIDFSSAGLYLCGLQTVVSVVVCSAASVACCWVLPAAAVSAVRTLAITSAVGLVCMRKPLRIGRVRGVTVIFNALRPCVALYILSLTLEQLVHTCVAADAMGGSWRHVIFHVMMLFIIFSAFIRAHRPRSETDVPFLLTTAALLVIAMLPPPATPLAGPLCQGPSLFSAAERLLRAMLFGSLYVIHVYAAAPSQNSIHEISVCTMRSGAAAVWILGVHIIGLALAPVQGFLALWARVGSDHVIPQNYTAVDARSDSGQSDTELGLPHYSDTLKESLPLVASVADVNGHTPQAEGIPVDPRALSSHGLLRQVNGNGSMPFAMGQAPGGTQGMTSERMAQIAAQIH